MRRLEGVVESSSKASRVKAVHAEVQTLSKM